METEVISKCFFSLQVAAWMLSFVFAFFFAFLAELLLDSYFTIVKRTVCDMVPKAVMLNLVNFTKDNLQKELLNSLYKSQSLRDSMKESDYVVSRRGECRKMIDVLAQAEAAIGNI